MTGEIKMRRQDIERMILSSRDRHRVAQLLGQTRLIPIYERQVNRWLDHWQESVLHGSIMVPS